MAIDENDKSLTLNLENLTATYRNLLIKYKQAVLDYTNELKINEPVLIEVKGQSFWGTTGISEGASNSEQECSASCSSTSGCTGATFNSEKKYCWLRSGDGSAIPGDENEYAIVLKRDQLFKVVNSVNVELNSVNIQIQQTINEASTLYKEQNDIRDVQNYSLIDQYNVLTTERENIDKMINVYQTLEASETEMNMYTTQNYYLFFILFMIVFICAIFLASFSIDKNTSNAISFGIVNPTIETTKAVYNSINPFYVMFGIILIFVTSYLYNQYITSLYNNAPSFKNMGQLGVVYIVFFIVIVFIAYSYFTKNNSGNFLPEMNLPQINLPEMNLNK
jgi:NADH:ubiquinone oxidoreductase subunit 3 (subunit A)